MATVKLITSVNTAMGRTLTESGFTIAGQIPVGSNNNPPLGVTGEKSDYTVLEIITHNSMPMADTAASLRVLAEKSRIICITRDLNPDIMTVLKKAGICDCIPGINPAMTAGYISLLSEPVHLTEGLFTVLDHDEAIVRIINGIVNRFGYSTIQTRTIDEFYQAISSNPPVMSLINLGTEGVDFNRFIRESNSSPIKKSPVIAYKDLSEGIFVHEVLNGLKKITKLILSPDELYSFIIDLLFNKKIVSAADAFNRVLDFDRYKHYGNMTVQQLYYEMTPNLCNRQMFLSYENTDKIICELETIKKYILLIEGIKWLTDHGNSRVKPTCAEDA